MHTLRLFAFVAIVLSAYASEAMPVSRIASDTVITLQSIEIRENRYSAFNTGSKSQSIDSASLSLYKSAGLEQILSNRSPVFIKNYGPGMLSTPSLRGSSASQTALLWNGLNIQSPMHGQNDFSLFPVIFADNIQIQHGSTGALWGSGAIGGAINLSNNIEFNGMLKVESDLQASTSQNYKQIMLISASGKNIASTLRFFNQNSNNIFDYKNPYITDSPIFKRDYAEVKQQGVMNEIYYKNNYNNFATLRWWYQNNERNIPPSLFQTHSGAIQNDETLRITADWQKLFNTGILSAKAAYFDETILFKDSTGIESLSNSNTWIQELDFRLFDYKRHSFNVGINNQIITAGSNHYNENILLQKFAIFSAWKWSNKPSTLSLFASIRQEWQENMEIPFVPSAGFAYSLFKNLKIKGNIGKNFRIPSINDLYWMPGGNPDLMPESGWNQDITLELIPDNRNLLKSDATILKISDLSLTGFHRKIDNWIIWLPQSGIWTPQNIMEVRSMGLEAHTSLEAQAGSTFLRLQLFYDYVSSKNEKQKSPNDESAGKQLIYVPLHSARAILTASHKAFGFYYEHANTGKRFTSSDNLYWLEPFSTGNMGVNYLLTIHQTLITLRFDVQNIWNESYMIVANNPMPLRFYQFGLSFKWNTSIK